MDQNIELRIVDPKTLEFKDKIDPRHIPADRISDAALKANAKAIGFVQPPLFAQDEDGTLTIISGRRRLRAAIANKVKELPILVKPADPFDNMRAVAENVVRAAMSPVDMWRAIESLASDNWTEDAIATAFAIPLRQVRKLRLLANVLPAMLDHIGRGDMPRENDLRTIASASLSEQMAAWDLHKPKKKEEVVWHQVARALERRKFYAHDAKFGAQEAESFGVVWEEDLFVPANEDGRFTTNLDGFLSAQRAWLEANLPENGQILDLDAYGSPVLPKGGSRIWSKPGPDDKIGFAIQRNDGAIREIAFELAQSTKTVDPSRPGEAAEPIAAKTRPDITQKGREMIGEMRTEALGKALARPEISDQTIISLLLLAIAGDNVSVRTANFTSPRSLIRKIAEGGKLTADTALIREVALDVLQRTLSCALKNHGSGLAARIAGDAIGADAELPTMATEEFLSSLSRNALEQLGAPLGVLPRPKVKETRAAVIEQARETRLVLPAAQFALSNEESERFSHPPYEYRGPSESDEDADEADEGEFDAASESDGEGEQADAA